MVNHPGIDQHEVLIFGIGGNHELVLQRRVSYPELISPNDIVALGQGRFFVTNDHGSPRTSVMHRLEDYLGLARSSLTYFDGDKGSFLINDLSGANGVALSKDKRTLYIAQSTARTLSRFERDGSIHQWSHVDSLYLNSAADNLEWDENGGLLIGSHPKLFDFLRHVNDPASYSPSHVLNVDVNASPMRFKTIYMNSGEALSGSSVATTLNGELLIGAVFENHFLRCQKVNELDSTPI